MRNHFYATTQDLDNQTHRFTVSATDPAPAGHEIVELRKARVFPVSSLLSRESLDNLRAAVR